ncbi:hypothetical protein FBU30_003339 [Linnemannia zychae]|nr:hypothetical protein FBU30_003339 [Linnemannia zychae]
MLSQLSESTIDLKIDSITITNRSGDDTSIAVNQEAQNEMNRVRKQATKFIDKFKTVNIVWNSKLDIATLVKELLENKKTGSFSLVINAGDREVLAEVKDAKRIHSIEVTGVPPRNPLEQSIFENVSLTSLTFKCHATSARFKKIVKDTQDITRLLNDTRESTPVRLPFQYLILMSNTSNVIAALFNIPQPSSVQSITPLTLDVKVKDLPTPTSLIKVYGSAIRVLNITKSSNDASNILKELSDSTHQLKALVTLTLLLKGNQSNHIDYMNKILESSKEKFTQLKLLSRPKDGRVKEKLVATLQRLEGYQILLAQTYECEIENWIKEATPSIGSLNVLIIVKSEMELKAKVPGIGDESITHLEEIFNNRGLAHIKFQYSPRVTRQVM